MCTLEALIANNHCMSIRDDLHKNIGIFKMETFQASTKKKPNSLTEFSELNTKANFQVTATMKGKRLCNTALFSSTGTTRCLNRVKRSMSN